MNAPTTFPVSHVAGVNLGHGHVKVQTSTRYFQYASITRPQNRADDSSVATFASAQVQRVQVNGQPWVVGEQAALTGTGVDRAVFTNWGTSPAYAALRQSGMDRLAEEGLGPWVLMLGMPVAQFHDQRYRQQLIASWQGKHETPHGTFVVDRVGATPEPLGAFWHYVLTTPSGFDRVQENQVMIVDLGYFTTDLNAVNRMVLNTGIGGSINRGTRDIYRSIANTLRETHSITCTELEIEMAVLGKWPIRVRGTKLDLESCLMSAARPLVGELTRWIRDQADVARGLILVAGGGASYMTPALRESFPVAEIIQLPHPQQANAKGYFHMAQHLGVAETA